MEEGRQGLGHKVKWLIRRSMRTIIIAACVIIFVWLLQEVGEKSMLKLDSIAYWAIVLHLRSETLTPVMETITMLAMPATLLVVWVVASAFAPGKRPGACMAVNLVGATLLNLLLKAIVQRPRPDGFRLVAETGYSFPSGHSMVAMAFYGLLAYLIWNYEKERPMRLLWCSCLGLVVIAVGISRIYLGVHYASDVIAGFCVSMAWLAVYTKVVCPLFLPEDEPVLDKTGALHLRTTSFKN